MHMPRIVQAVSDALNVRAGESGVVSARDIRMDGESMKPRIVKSGGLWYCMSEICGSGPAYTPKDAYDEWLAIALGIYKP